MKLKGRERPEGLSRVLPEPDVLIIGAGIAGLSAAVTLQDQGLSVRVLEAAATPGGHFRSEREGGYVFAHGPQAIPGFASSALAFVETLGLSEALQPARAANQRHVWRKGRMASVPFGALSLGGWLRVLSEPFRARPACLADDESVSSFFLRRIGKEATEALIGPFVSGIHAGDPDALEAASAFPKLVSWEREHGSLFRGAWAARRERARLNTPSQHGLFSFPGGLDEIVQACVARLGESLQVRCKVDSLGRDSDGWRVSTGDGELRASQLILAVPPPATARLLEGIDEEASQLAASVPMAPVAVCHLGGPLKEGVQPPEGFGLLVPRSAGFHTLGTVFTSSLFPCRAPAGAWLQSTFLGGATNEGLLDRDDEALRSLVNEESERLLGFAPDAGTCRIFRHSRAIPQLVRGHAGRMRTLRTRLAPFESLSLAGSWLDGVGLEHGVKSGLAAAGHAMTHGVPA